MPHALIPISDVVWQKGYGKRKKSDLNYAPLFLSPLTAKYRVKSLEFSC